ncbi:MAG: GspH/FimT family pseudopilin [Enterobacteriaceae bacterium]
MKSVWRLARGFSLLELLLVLTLVGMVSYLSLSSWQRLQQMWQLEEASLQLLHFLHQTQRVARWHNETLAIEVQRATGGHAEEQWQLSPRQGEREMISPFKVNGAQVILQEESASEQIQFFGRRGGASGGHFTLSNGAGQVQVIVSAKGRIRRCSVEGSVSGLAPC